MRELGPRNAALLARRGEPEAGIDAWHRVPFPGGCRFGAGQGPVLNEGCQLRRDKEIVADGGRWLYFCASDDASCSASILAFGKGPIVECKIQCPANGLRASRIGPRARENALQPARIVAIVSTTVKKIVDKLTLLCQQLGRAEPAAEPGEAGALPVECGVPPGCADE